MCPFFPTHRLAEKIRVAKVAKERSLQLQEKAQIRVQQAEYNTAFDTYVKRGRGRGEDRGQGQRERGGLGAGMSDRAEWEGQSE